jgi:hypothetical protein
MALYLTKSFGIWANDDQIQTKSKPIPKPILQIQTQIQTLHTSPNPNPNPKGLMPNPNLSQDLLHLYFLEFVIPHWVLPYSQSPSSKAI